MKEDNIEGKKEMGRVTGEKDIEMGMGWERKTSRITGESKIEEDKLIVYKGRWRRPHSINENEKKDIERSNQRFSKNYRGDILISAKLKEKYCSKSKETNMIKIGAIIYKEK